MPTAKKPATKQAQSTEATAHQIHNTGAHISHCNFENKAAPVSDKAAEALAELARASQAHAAAISEIAKALKGAEAHMNHGIHLSGVSATN